MSKNTRGLCRTHKARVLNNVITWKDWRMAWDSARTEAELLGLLHTGFKASIWKTFPHGSQGRDPVLKTERYRFYLHVADCDSGYPEAVQTKAFEVLFGGRNLPLDGIFPNSYAVDKKEIATLCWFLRPVKADTSNNFLYENYKVIDANSHQRAMENFWNGVEKVFPDLWFNQYDIGKKGHGYYGLTVSWQRTIAFRILLRRLGTDHLVKEICRGVNFKEPPYGSWGELDPDLKKLFGKVKLIDQKCLDIIKSSLSRYDSLEQALLVGNSYAQFLEWFSKLQSVYIPEELNRRKEKREHEAAEKKAAEKERLLREKEYIEKQLAEK